MAPRSVQKMHSPLKVTIDPQSGFCFGVVTAIRKAEEELARGGSLYCLGDIVHNSAEVQRLREKGLATITHADLETLSGVKVLLRAHGEPPSTYAMAHERDIEIIDATCPVVLRLQQRIKDDRARNPLAQIVIYGKTGHAEVNGLVGQTEGEAIVVESPDDIGAIDFSRPVSLYSQTTKSPEGYAALISNIESRMAPGVDFHYSDTICRQVANRTAHLRDFAATQDVVIFVAGHKSSNGRILYGHCLDVNPRTHLVADASEVDPQWFAGASNVGICGATSTPSWLMEQVRQAIEDIN